MPNDSACDAAPFGTRVLTYNCTGYNGLAGAGAACYPGGWHHVARPEQTGWAADRSRGITTFLLPGSGIVPVSFGHCAAYTYSRKYNQNHSSLRCDVFIWTREIWQPLSSHDSNDAVTQRTLSIRVVPLSVARTMCHLWQFAAAGVLLPVTSLVSLGSRKQTRSLLLLRPSFSAPVATSNTPAVAHRQRAAPAGAPATERPARS